jgi:hypothetical protein
VKSAVRSRTWFAIREMNMTSLSATTVPPPEKRLMTPTLRLRDKKREQARIMFE